MKKYAESFTPVEMMIVAAARELSNGQVLMTGTQWPVIVAVFAKRTHAPDLVFAFEGGIICDSLPSRTPLTSADPCLISSSILCGDTMDTLGMMLHANRVDVALLPAASVDRYGNINTTCFGDYAKPEFRLGGSGGACDFACLAPKVMIILEHDQRRFPEKVNYLTSPGYIDGGSGRQKAGLRPDTGPWAVFTTLGRFKFDRDSGEMYLDGYYRGVNVNQIKENMGWEIKISKSVREIEPPTEEDLRILREEIDPRKMYLENARARGSLPRK